MPQTIVLLYRDDNGSVPFLDWFDGIPRKAQDKCRVRIERLRELGYELRRPEADYLRDGIYELRVRLKRVNYRMLYFFHGDAGAVLSHGLVKEKKYHPRKSTEPSCINLSSQRTRDIIRMRRRE
jgi:phage-related protein